MLRWCAPSVSRVFTVARPALSSRMTCCFAFGVAERVPMLYVSDAVTDEVADQRHDTGDIDVGTPRAAGRAH